MDDSYLEVHKCTNCNGELKIIEDLPARNISEEEKGPGEKKGY